MSQSISGENQLELVRETANLHSGKMGKGRNPGQAVLERGALLELGPACCCTPCLGPLGTQELPGAEGGTTLASGGCIM